MHSLQTVRQHYAAKSARLCDALESGGLRPWVGPSAAGWPDSVVAGASRYGFKDAKSILYTLY